jgi:hypothetical protein
MLAMLAQKAAVALGLRLCSSAMAGTVTTDSVTTAMLQKYVTNMARSIFESLSSFFTFFVFGTTGVLASGAARVVANDRKLVFPWTLVDGKVRRCRRKAPPRVFSEDHLSMTELHALSIARPTRLEPSSFGSPTTEMELWS